MAPRGSVTIGRLDSLASVRREAARLYTEARRGQLDPGDATRLGQLLQLIARLLSEGEIERRLEALERGAPSSDAWRPAA
jgi:hypothetical protein